MIDFKEAVKAMRSRTGKLEHEGDYWTSDDIELLRTMFNNFEGLTDIAITLQRTEVAVMQQIEKLDLYGRKNNPRRCRICDKTEDKCLCEKCKLRDICNKEECKNV